MLLRIEKKSGHQEVKSVFQVHLQSFAKYIKWSFNESAAIIEEILSGFIYKEGSYTLVKLNNKTHIIE